jgi:hypothetical protein
LALARRQGALAWELRASTTLAQLLASTGKAGEARVLLAAAIAQFDQGTRMADLANAQEVLERLTVIHRA